jgi:ER lumen protein retaining receptor
MIPKACIANVQLLLLLWLVIEDHDNLFVMAEAVHFIGIAILVYKLVSKRNCGGAHSECFEVVGIMMTYRPTKDVR